MSVTSAFTSGTIPKVYKSLTASFAVRPIHNERRLADAMKVVDALAIRDNLTADQQDYLDALGTMIEAYENERHRSKMSNLKPKEVLDFLLKENGMSRNALGRLLGQPSLGSAILCGRRGLSKQHISTLCDRFRMDASVFLR